jgi:hypothetical protein
MNSSQFFLRYAASFDSIQGMFSFEASLLMAAYAQVAAECRPRANTLEIGVHHGLSAILVAALRGDGGRFVAVDLFEELQHQNESRSGLGSRERFLSNMAAFYDDLNFMRVIAASSSSLKASDLGRTFSFCHIDGGHSARETYGDLVLCSEILMPDGIVVLDDYFNSSWPGVCEGAIRFAHEDKGKTLVPLAIGFNKVLFQKKADSRWFSQKKESNRLNEAFLLRFPQVPNTTVQLWGSPVFHFGSNFSSWLDLEKSTPHHLVVRDAVAMRVNLDPKLSAMTGQPGQVLALPIRVENLSDMVFCFSEQPIGLSYHLTTPSGHVVAFENVRQYFYDPLRPGEERLVDLPIACPDLAGQYLLEVDLVWEGICWFKQKGNKTPLVPLQVV